MKTITKMFAMLLMAVFLVGMMPLVSAQKTDNDTWNTEFKMKVDQAKQAYEDAKEQYKKDVEEFKNKNKEAKEQYRHELLNAASKRLEKHIEVLTLVLERTRSKLESTNMSDEGVIADIDSVAEKLEQIKEELSQNENITREELKQYIVDVKSLGKELRDIVVSAVDNMKNNRLGNVLVNIEALQDKFDKMRNKSENSSQFDDYLSELNDNLDQAKESYNTALDLFDQAKEAETAEERSDLIRQAHDAQRETFDILKDIRQDLRNLLSEVKASDHDREETKSTEGNESEEE